MALVKVGSVSQLPPGSVMEAEVEGNTYAVCNVDGDLHALDGICPHAGGPLGQGALHGTTLVCPWHAWEYDCRTGANDLDPDLKVETFPVKVDGGEILLDIP
jgi:nitrite reductase/ring-hydroxylating ferredoxin subunit